MVSKHIENKYSHLKTGLTIFFSGLALIFFYLAREVISVFLLSAIIAIAIFPMLEFAEKRKISGILALLIVYMSCGFIFMVLFIDLAPVVIEGISNLIQDIPSVVQVFVDKASAFAEQRKINFIPKEQINVIIADASKYLAGQIVDMTKNTLSFIGTFLFIMVISFFLALDHASIKKGFVNFFPREYGDYLEKKIVLFNNAVRKAFFGKVIVTGIVGVIVLIGYWALQIDRFIALSVITFFLNFIPFIGSTLAAIIGIIFGLQNSLFAGVAVLILHLAANFIEMNIATPIFMGKEASLHPVLILLAIGIGASVWGLLGVVISIPFAAAIIAVSSENQKSFL